MTALHLWQLIREVGNAWSQSNQTRLCLLRLPVLSVWVLVLVLSLGSSTTTSQRNSRALFCNLIVLLCAYCWNESLHQMYAQSSAMCIKIVILTLHIYNRCSVSVPGTQSAKEVQEHIAVWTHPSSQFIFVILCTYICKMCRGTVHKLLHCHWSHSFKIHSKQLLPDVFL